MSREEESAYYAEIKKIASDIVHTALDYDAKFEQIVKQLSAIVYSTTNLPVHAKKTVLNVQDDLFLMAKSMMLKRLPGNNNALFMGRFQPPSRNHVNIMRDVINKFDGLVVAVVKGGKSDKSKNPFPFELQEEMIKKAVPGARVIRVNTGNIITAINKSPIDVSTIVAGTDRVAGYQKQIDSMNLDMNVYEIDRSNVVEGSGTEVRDAIARRDEARFKELTDPAIWSYWDALTKYVPEKKLDESVMKFEEFERKARNI
jgi:nicotinamide mononucleotide adenylyltransferase